MTDIEESSQYLYKVNFAISDFLLFEASNSNEIISTQALNSKGSSSQREMNFGSDTYLTATDITAKRVYYVFTLTLLPVFSSNFVYFLVHITEKSVSGNSVESKYIMSSIQHLRVKSGAPLSLPYSIAVY
jgi:hypothetical protein